MNRSDVVLYETPCSAQATFLNSAGEMQVVMREQIEHEAAAAIAGFSFFITYCREYKLADTLDDESRP